MFHNVACVADEISVGVLYWFVHGAVRRVGIQVNFDPCGFATRFAWRLRRQESTPGARIPPATQAT